MIQCNEMPIALSKSFQGLSHGLARHARSQVLHIVMTLAVDWWIGQMSARPRPHEPAAQCSVTRAE